MLKNGKELIIQLITYKASESLWTLIDIRFQVKFYAEITYMIFFKCKLCPF